MLLELLRDFEVDMYDDEEKKKFCKYWKKVVDKVLKEEYKEIKEWVGRWEDENEDYVVGVILKRILKENGEKEYE